MKTNLQIATDFVQKIPKENILQIVLFGSVARGEDTKISDIDIAIIHDSKDEFKLRKEVNKDKPSIVQTTFVHIKKLPKETEITGALSGEGLLLYGRPIILKEKKTDLKPKILISYNLSDLRQTNKVKCNRALYGSISRSNSDDKEYTTKTIGVAKSLGVEKINNGVLLADRRVATKILHTLSLFHVRYKEIPLWTY